MLVIARGYCEIISHFWAKQSSITWMQFGLSSVLPLLSKLFVQPHNWLQYIITCEKEDVCFKMATKSH